MSSSNALAPTAHDFWEVLPKWQYVSGRTIGAYNVFWKYPPGFKDDIMPKVFQCPILLDRITERFQQILNSGQFNIDEITLLFRRTGFHISVPGNACGIDPDYRGNSMCGHNVDSPSQTYSLCFLLLTMLDEIYQIASIWENHPDTGIEETDQNEKWLTLTRSRESKPFRLWGVKDSDFHTCGYVYARDWEEAREAANQFYPEKCQRVEPEPYWSTEPRPFVAIPKRRYTVLVFTKNGEMQSKTIDTFTRELAISEAKKSLDPNCILDVRVDNCEEI
ncbi:MAG: hypothetical protein CEN89_562 [Candidatus Berkelbacteria bacterium Licking1014_7]|uniref:Uncharacterized protein n=1 Tax=Candidatus Berkelbacteria bacterium Licking1014_7 TaxID=2017147 RepID=A0A554LIF1_9BACT|nr:MAG: hypothetical protein CEN89_562 [Candidatus Berkelbacteria bacterium Licking1014_7]